MSRHTITITAPNGAKVRTVASRTFFVVSFGETTSTYNSKTGEFDSHEPKPFATVVKHTNDVVVAERELRKSRSRAAYRYSPSAAPEFQVAQLDSETLAGRADAEKARRAFAQRRGNQGEARRLFY